MHLQQGTLDYIQQCQNKMYRDVMAWSAINSGSYHVAGLEKMATEIEQRVSALGAQVKRIPLAPLVEIADNGERIERPMGPLLQARKRPEAPLQILFCGHMDTVFAKEHPFQTPVVLSEGVVNGPGVADMKGGILVFLTALEALEKTGLTEQFGWEVLINPDEEIGSISSAPYLEEAARRHHVGLVYEPAVDENGTLAGARKGSGRFVYEVKGITAHAGRAFDDGRHAIAALSELITGLHQLNGQREGVTINVAHLTGGGPLNVVPDFALCRVGIRTKTQEDEQWYLDASARVIERVMQADGISIEVKEQLFTRTPKPCEGKTKKLFELVKTVGDALSQPIRWVPTGGCCDGNNLAAAGLPVVDTLGVRGGKIHSDEEYLIVDSLAERAQLTAGIVAMLIAHKKEWQAV